MSMKTSMLISQTVCDMKTTQGKCLNTPITCLAFQKNQHICPTNFIKVSEAPLDADYKRKENICSENIPT